jgi:RHS repeat-associated protein
VGGSFARTLLPEAVPNATYDAANRQLTFGDKTMTFDDNGSLAALISETPDTTTFTWDARDRLVGLGGPGLTASFQYDALGLRKTKTVNGRASRFLYDGFDIVRETGPDVETSYVLGLGIDDLLLRAAPSGVTYYLIDGLNSVAALSDGTGGISAEATYEPFGRIAVTGPLGETAFGFTSRETDETGLYFYRMRYYHPSLGRFLSEDPIGIAGGDINLYAYVLNNPTTYVDPYGLWRFLPGGRTFFPSQRYIPPSARPIPRPTPDPNPLPPPPWQPPPRIWPEGWRLRNPFGQDKPLPINPCPWDSCIGTRVGPLPLPGSREKPPTQRPEPKSSPEWEECFRLGPCT